MSKFTICFNKRLASDVYPAGYVAPGDKYKGLPTISLQVTSELVRTFALTPALDT